MDDALGENEKEDYKAIVERNLKSQLVLKNIKKVIDGFKKKLGLNSEKNEFVEAN
eukprot:CAMPEP_0116896848 /NCGR_PEP_ID=MMETSP0467-20121206/5993_1 /TAXON_ID=283647 /ORGANISM="Mesodinium pulex, Strain SPMC105" /LENGTH=54 /DNA_ID=CAMNT_0004568231 /DNA_START=1780 /DNA_END=1944 /DNA_ORIENTATION=-